ncbi:esterase family protein [Halanaerobium congolense]|jgi:esterase/lipase superfamily enzyme|uniref:Esterase/lipase superfamily enzyme n=1 Tax=Halanaerobium congolense TaxID=54121 RepID=A0A1G7IEB0_9FIRM|nr:alpha/beta hydrolase-fold protein [Halanaerobium congolense]PTX17280.1 esterase/lipase superfamily enzyme [Halanaerobium congolense]PXV66981.1 esterase/lipase superfamily enzyme [Halanaerobium congolense]TDP25631.1 esterase/lipase superfamily enzyme [Halanaerobium congolense]TDS29824.1 esterase/lipase superfamily enzyme [Halanaerobium congolense]TDX45481.1 esterase/lipase superfamily enzyme [Halanaerobium congolense]
MKIEYRNFYSSNLNQNMPFKIYGYAGKPMLVFPSSGGSFHEYEDFDMIDAIWTYIENGEITVYTVSSIDNESWLNHDLHPHDKAVIHNNYDRYIIDEMLPLIKYHSNWQGGIISSGCSMGAYHAVNFYFHHPDAIDTCIALSGIYDARFFTGGYMDQEVYLNSPVDYLKELQDEWYLNHYRKNDLIICAGQGRWEEDTLRDTRLLDTILAEKGIPSWFDYWGYDADHDWPWWRKQMPYFLELLKEKNIL